MTVMKGSVVIRKLIAFKNQTGLELVGDISEWDAREKGKIVPTVN
tara:strand:- start:4515 stop:4649 length:135 start_codon:yes stop_codon:yes gene_type:complete